MESGDKSLKWCLTNFFWFLAQRLLPAKIYLSLRYRLLFGYWVNWENPKALTEKLQWLKLYRYGENESHLVDKIKVKEYVAQVVGEQYVVPTIGSWSKVDDIPFDTLPEEYVLKCNHDSGSVFIATKGMVLNREMIKKQLAKRLQTNYYWTGRETPYKFVEPRVFAEPMIKSSAEGGLRDYKFFCFNGCPKVFKIDFYRFIDHHANYYDVEGNLLPFGEVSPPPSFEKKLDVPENLSEMVEVARKLSHGLPFARVDLYNVDGKIFFGEITLFPTSGFGQFTDPQWDERLGEWVDLS